jgi:hypothetical protein
LRDVAVHHLAHCVVGEVIEICQQFFWQRFSDPLDARTPFNA